MLKITVGSTNPIKTEAVKMGFAQMFPQETFEFFPVSAASDISNQPLSDTETLQGALNRTQHASELSPDSDFYVGLEGGIEEINGELHEFAWIVVRSKDGKIGKGKTATFFLPNAFKKLVLEENKEVGEASDILFGETNSKQKMGAIGLLTHGVIDRAELYRHAVIIALVPFIRPEHY